MRAYIALAAAALLAGCQQQADIDSAPAASAASSTLPGTLVISAGRLVLPAVPGRPGAAYFTLFNPGPGEATITSLEIVGAQAAEMHETIGTTMQQITALSVPAGKMVMLAPGGKHVMAFALAPGITAGGTARLTIHLNDGRQITGELKVEGPGEEDTTPAIPAKDDTKDDMAGMKM